MSDPSYDTVAHRCEVCKKPILLWDVIVYIYDGAHYAMGVTHGHRPVHFKCGVRLSQELKEQPK